jgi:hypothetical protein
VGTTPNEWDGSDTQTDVSASPTFSTGVATFSGLSIAVNTTPKHYIITLDIAASPVDTAALQASVSAITHTDTAGHNANVLDTVDATITVDTSGPNSASFGATAGDQQCNLSWSSTTDNGSGMDSSEPYEVRWQKDTSFADCSGGDQLFIGTGLSTTHSSLINGDTYYYRLCYKDALGNQSESNDNPVTCTPEAAVDNPPGNTTDFTIMQNYARGLLLRWTPPNDDAGVTASGPANYYDIRYTDAADYPTSIDKTYFDTNWEGSVSNKAAYEPAPVDPESGTVKQFFTLSCIQADDTGNGNETCISPGGPDERVLPNTLYYTSLKAKDDLDANILCQGGALNCSEASNVPYYGDTNGSEASHTALRYGWNMVSMPYDWSSNGTKTLSNIFVDDVSGPYVYRWDSTGPLETDGNWVTVNTGSTFSTLISSPNYEMFNGKGYYLSSYSYNDVADHRDSGDTELLSQNSNASVAIPLEPGRNLIGNPYLKNVRLYDSSKTADEQLVYICVSNGGTVTGYVGNACTGSGTLTRKTFDEAVNDTDYSVNGWVDNAISFFVNETTPSAEPYASAKLRPWWGVWLLVNEDPWRDSTDGAGLGSAPADPDDKVMLIIIKP